MVEIEPPIMMTISNTEAVEKGAVLQLADPYTATAASGDEDNVAGIAAEEKIASDGKTKIAIYRRGIFKMLAQGNIAVGAAVSTSAATGSTVNSVQSASKTSVGSKTLGLALEAAADEETLLVDLRIGCNTNAYA